MRGCMGEGKPLRTDIRQYLTLEACQKTCDNTSDCNAIAWNSRDDRCFLKYKKDACEDRPCPWNRTDARDWNFYWKTCGNFVLLVLFRNNYEIFRRFISRNYIAVACIELLF